MRSIPQALIWELWRHGRWYLLVGLLGANVLPGFLFAALEYHGAIDSGQTSFLIMHVVLVQINAFVFAAMTFCAQGNLARLYAMPASTPTLVAWHLLPMMVLVGGESAASSAALNAQFGLDWPIWGPAFFAAVMVAAIAALHWVTEHSGWEFLAMLTVPLALGLWFKSRYGAAFSLPDSLWRQVTPAEGATLVALALLAYVAAVYGVSRNRRGRPMPSIGLIAWLDRLLDPAPYRGGPFRSPLAAQFWFEWRKKGIVMPAAAVMGLVLGLVLWLIANRNLGGLLEGLIAGGGLLSLAAMLGGVVMGNCGRADDDFRLTSFQATRPITDAKMAGTLLKAAFFSVSLAWLIWALAIAAFFLLHAVLRVPAPQWPRALGWWFFPAAFIGAWAVLGLVTSLGLLGRAMLLLYLSCGLFSALIVSMSVVKFTLSPEHQRMFWQVVVTIVGAIAIFASGLAFLAARRRQLIGWTTVYVAASLWVALCGVVVLADVLHARGRYALLAALIAVCALAVAPLATAPLALVYNRHR